jgi:hypothetical protein
VAYISVFQNYQLQVGVVLGITLKLLESQLLGFLSHFFLIFLGFKKLIMDFIFSQKQIITHLSKCAEI